MLTYLAMKHDARVRRVDTVRAYSFGALYFVEVSQQANMNLHTSWACILSIPFLWEIFFWYNLLS
jgi:hypothetical protein